MVSFILHKANKYYVDGENLLNFECTCTTRLTNGERVCTTLSQDCPLRNLWLVHKARTPLFIYQINENWKYSPSFGCMNVWRPNVLRALRVAEVGFPCGQCSRWIKDAGSTGRRPSNGCKPHMREDQHLPDWLHLYTPDVAATKQPILSTSGFTSIDSFL